MACRLSPSSLARRQEPSLKWIPTTTPTSPSRSLSTRLATPRSGRWSSPAPLLRPGGLSSRSSRSASTSPSKIALSPTWRTETRLPSCAAALPGVTPPPVLTPYLPQSSDVELAELFASLDPTAPVLRLELVLPHPAALPTLSANATNHVTEAGAAFASEQDELFSELGSEDSDDSLDEESSVGGVRPVEAHRRRTPWELVDGDSSDEEPLRFMGSQSMHQAAMPGEEAPDVFVDDESEVEEPRMTTSSSKRALPATDELLDKLSTSNPSATTVETAPEVEAADPTDEPLPDGDSTTPDPAEDALPPPPTADTNAEPAIPAALSAFLSSFGARAEDLQSHVHTLLADPSPARLSALFASAPTEVPTLVRGLTTEVTQLVGDLFQGFRREADGLREEFGKFREVVEEEKRTFEEAMREMKAEMEKKAAASPEEEEVGNVEAEEESEEVTAERKARLRSQKMEEKVRVRQEERRERNERKEERRASKALKQAEREDRKLAKAAAKAGKAPAQETSGFFCPFSRRSLLTLSSQTSPLRFLSILRPALTVTPANTSPSVPPPSPERTKPAGTRARPSPPPPPPNSSPLLSQTTWRQSPCQAPSPRPRKPRTGCTPLRTPSSPPPLARPTTSTRPERLSSAGPTRSASRLPRSALRPLRPCRDLSTLGSPKRLRVD